ncbi:BRCT domain-containing protein [Leifsonia sp. Leaf264]|uniref:BRCT domain-containing protein n=1 Tax=Leifsonia sp. Leaf264 TaxID=1736314 RepID=UPI00138F910A|nr:BRCT domain-containing protein [Leifsonia sp. Leaf264]
MTDIDTLIATRNAAAAAYYEGESIMDDADFDKLTAELAEQGVEEVVGHGYVPEGKVKHERRMLSLDKIQADEDGKPEHAFNDLAKFVENTDAWNYDVELKFDGNAVALTYVDGKLTSAVTRGDGTFGESVDYAVGLMADAGVLPRTLIGAPPKLILKAEILFKLPVFEELNESLEESYSNPRNAAAGIVRRQHGTEAALLSLIVHDSDIVDDDQVSHWGFTTSANIFKGKVGGTVGRTIGLVTRDLFEQIDRIDKLRGVLDFETDGAVIKVTDRVDRRTLGEGSRTPKWAVAYKFNSAVHEVVVTGLEWQLGRTGKLTPVITYTAPPVAGWTNTKATGHNFELVEKLDPRVGDTLRMKRSGEVIPFIMGRLEGAPRGAEEIIYPTEFTAPDGVTYPVIRDGVNLKVDGYLNPVQLIVYGLGMLGVKGVSDSVVKKLVDGGDVRILADMLTVTVQDVAKYPGEGVGSGTVVVNAIKDALRGATVVQWFAGIGLPHMALTTGGILADRFGDLDTIAQATEAELLVLPKFGPIKTANFLANQHKVAELAAALRERGYTPLPKEQIVAVESPLTGKNVVLTGTFPNLSRSGATDAAKRLGANTQSSVSKTTDILIAGDGAGSKMAKAESLGVQVMSAEEFEALI